ncbi:MAG: ABC transporter ATP-binding protein [Bacteroidetes bacterium]|nr:ABC transporter ATP-binding protein [Bacteroidota bacterium]MBU1114779.1 ABC transporter ATP-binding protein [Bacteroidota bacterium]MBU1799070.1 ABC transporter ATP-binding protein [Bacteroidota bacterium]
MAIVIECNDIHKSFQKRNDERLEILKGISLSIDEGKINVIVGKSGAGKSTLLHILAGLDKPDLGIVDFDGINIHKLNDDDVSKFRNQNLGFVFQFHHLLPEFTALENISIPQLIAGVNKTKAEERSLELLEIVGLVDRSDHRPSELSGGEQQRVAMARALANNPKIIFADEPTGNLDTTNSTIIHDLIKKLRDDFNLTFLIVTHNQDLMNIGDRIIEMRDGIIFET